MFSSQNSQVSSDANYIEDVFSTYLYKGNGSTQTITNGIDLSTKGGLLWIKNRTNHANSGNDVHLLFDTQRGSNKYIFSNLTNAEVTSSAALSSFNANGFTLNTAAISNESNLPFASWTFRKQPKFFDVVTYTGNGTNGRAISHNLGSVPGCIIVKRTDTTSDWAVYHQALGTGNSTLTFLNQTAAASTPNQDYFGNGVSVVVPTSTQFTVGFQNNANAGTYVAYIFAHNAGGFGLTGTDNVISCGSFTTNVSGGFSVNLGYEPQWVMIKSSGGVGGWFMLDNMRGLAATGTNGTDQRLYANTSGAEATDGVAYPTATGFGAVNSLLTSTAYIYIAIRRGPMKVPTSGTSVFSPIARSGTSATANVSTGFITDATIIKNRAGGFVGEIFDRLRGANTRLYPDQTSAESTTTDHLTSFATNDGYALGASASGEVNLSGYNYANWNFRRAPSFFDEVCYTGTGSTIALNHNLAAVPELMIVKSRGAATGNWVTYTATYGSGSFIRLNSTSGNNTGAGNLWGATTPTSSLFYVGEGGAGGLSVSANNYVAYLFATCAGVSKVGSYTGNGSSQTINCGFTSGARFVLIKATSTTGNWGVFDTARGITSGNDPCLRLNTTTAEDSGPYVGPDSTGFTVGTDWVFNESGVTYIFLAIA